MILISHVLAIILTVLAIALGGLEKLLFFWDTPSFLLIVFTILLLAFASGKWSLFVRGLSEAAEMKAHQPGKDSEEIAALFLYLFWGNFLGGVFWSIVGWVLMLADLRMEYLGSGIAVSLLTIFYAIFFSLFLLLPISMRFSVSTKK